jgi:hypothetical protein
MSRSAELTGETVKLNHKVGPESPKRFHFVSIEGI